MHISGVIVQETHETFRIVTDGTIKCKYARATNPSGIPKHNTVFRLDLPLDDGYLACDVHGNQVRYTLPTRVTRKHKARKTTEI